MEVCRLKLRTYLLYFDNESRSIGSDKDRDREEEEVLIECVPEPETVPQYSPVRSPKSKFLSLFNTDITKQRQGEKI